jgi:hypothetical protein
LRDHGKQERGRVVQRLEPALVEQDRLDGSYGGLNASPF